MISNAKKLKTTMITPSKSLIIRGSPSHRASKGSVTPKVTSKSRNNSVNKNDQRDQDENVSM
jgi:hypothetical protein